MALSVTLDLYTQAFGRVDKNRTRDRRSTALFYQLDRKQVRTNPMLHTQSYTLIVLLLLCTCVNHQSVTIQMYHPPNVVHTFALQIGGVTNHLLHSEMEHMNWQTSSSFALWDRVFNNNYN